MFKSPRKSFFRLTDRREFPLFREHRDGFHDARGHASGRQPQAETETKAAYLQLELRPGNPRGRILRSNPLKDFGISIFSK
jgi:hypothetical protein